MPKRTEQLIISSRLAQNCSLISTSRMQRNTHIEFISLWLCTTTTTMISNNGFVNLQLSVERNRSYEKKHSLCFEFKIFGKWIFSIHILFISVPTIPCKATTVHIKANFN